MQYIVKFVVLHRKETMTRKVQVREPKGPADAVTQQNIREALCFDLDCGPSGIQLISVVENTDKSPQTWYASPADVTLANSGSTAAQLPPRKTPPPREAILDPAKKKVELQEFCEQWPVPLEVVNPAKVNKEELANAIVAFLYPEPTKPADSQ